MVCYHRLESINSVPANAPLGQYIFQREADGKFSAFLVLEDEELAPYKAYTPEQITQLVA